MCMKLRCFMDKHVWHLNEQLHYLFRHSPFSSHGGTNKIVNETHTNIHLQMRHPCQGSSIQNIFPEEEGIKYSNTWISQTALSWNFFNKDSFRPPDFIFQVIWTALAGYSANWTISACPNCSPRRGITAWQIRSGNRHNRARKVADDRTNREVNLLLLHNKPNTMHASS